LISHLVTNVPGSSTYYRGGVTAYANEVKIQLLGVRSLTLEKYGAVSQETVLEMARGIRQALDCALGLSVSGIAGPDGGTVDKPVGTIWIGFCATDREICQHYILEGNRAQIKEQAAGRALQLVIDYLSGDPNLREISHT
jgi:PncC family amidohydrolase